MALKLIKNKIKSIQRTSKVTKAMEAVSAVKMRKSQERALDGRTYAETALRILERVSHVRDAQEHPLFAPHNEGKHCIIVITSDKGLAGSLNSSVLKEVSNRLREYAVQDVEIVCFGKKSYEHFIRRGYSVPLHYLNVRDDVAIEAMEEVVSLITNAFIEKKYKSVHVVYQTFVSTFEQNAVQRELLPLKTSAIQEIVQGIIPKHGKYSDIHLETKPVAYTVEPNQEAVYKEVFPLLIKIMLYHALLESKASEHSARMVAMKNATDKAKEVSKILTLKYNKERQSIITAEVSEITGGIEAMKNS
jgi:F-type H+-transporting ATPase subunit gamma